MLFETQAKCHFMLALPIQKSKATLLDTPGISSVFSSCAIRYTLKLVNVVYWTITSEISQHYMWTASSRIINCCRTKLKI